MVDLGKYEDEKLIQLLNRGNEKAFNEIYNRYWSKLLAQATYDLRDEGEAEECVQDVFVKLWKRRKELTLHYKLSTYLFRAIKNQVINVLEKRHALQNKLVYLAHSDGYDFVPSPQALMIEKELMQALDHAISTLPEKCNLIYRMSREEGKSNAQIAKELSISEKTVEGHMTRALKHLSKNVVNTSVTSLIILVAELVRNR